MRKVQLMFVAAFVALSISAGAQGVKFEKGTFAEAVAKAKKENKLVFVDFYTTWCGPCKKMDKEIFPKEIVGSYFNEKFVSIKIDAEKGEGIQLAEKYTVKGYPTMLVLNSDESEKDRLVGATPDAEFLVKFAKKVNGEGIDFMEIWTAYEQEGNRQPEFIATLLGEGGVYASTIKDQEEQREWFNKFYVISKWYFAVVEPEDLLNQQGFKMIATYLDGPNNRNKFVEFVYNNYDEYKKFVPVDELTMFIMRTNNQSIHEAAGNGDLSFREYVEAINGRLAQAHADAPKSDDDKGDTYEIMRLVAEGSYAKSQGDYDGYLDWCEKYKAYNDQIGKDNPWHYSTTVGNLLYETPKLTSKQISRCHKLIAAGLKQDAKNRQLIGLRGDLYAMQGNNTKAIQDYNRVIELVKGQRGEDYFKEQMTKKIEDLKNNS